MNFNTSIALLLLCLLGTNIQAQPNEIVPLKPGEKLPEATITNVININGKSINLSQYKGKVLIIDFWGTYCGACVASLPKVNEFQKEFGDKVQILLVSSESKETIEAYNSNVKRLEKLSITIPLLYSDTLLRKLFPYRSIPHYAWIDTDGVFKMATDAYDLTRENLVAAIKGNYVKLAPSFSTGGRLNIDVKQPFFNEQLSRPFYQNEGTYKNTKYKISITGYIDSLPGRDGGSLNYTGRILNRNTTIASLYKNAFTFTTGKMQLWGLNRMEFLVKDKFRVGLATVYSKFEDLGLTGKEYRQKVLVVSDLILPEHYEGFKLRGKNPDSLRTIQAEILKMELANCFPYTASIEKRVTDCYVLKALDSNLFKSKGGKEAYSMVPGYLGATFTNKKISDFCFQFELWNGGVSAPIIDETLYKGKVDLRIDAPLQGIENLHKVNEQLEKQGLTIVQEKRELDFIVIRDK